MHEVMFVRDDELPKGRDFVLCRMDNGDALFIAKESRLSERVLERGWAAVRETRPGPDWVPRIA